ncbi:Uncharacterised protein [uncultured archaeon]|nr:Uncharacterised protein [uncultured archaeon]
MYKTLANGVSVRLILLTAPPPPPPPPPLCPPLPPVGTTTGAGVAIVNVCENVLERVKLSVTVKVAL